MGVFSWITADTGQSITVWDVARLPVFMLDPAGAGIFEAGYEGYGRFGPWQIDALAHAAFINDLVPRPPGYPWHDEDDLFDCPYHLIDAAHDAAFGETDDGEDFFTLLQRAQTDSSVNILPLKFATTDVNYFSVGASRRCPHQGLLAPSPAPPAAPPTPRLPPGRHL